QEQLLRQARVVRSGPGDPTDVNVPAATARREVYQQEDEPPGPVRAYAGPKPTKSAPAQTSVPAADKPPRDPTSARVPAAALSDAGASGAGAGASGAGASAAQTAP